MFVSLTSGCLQPGKNYPGNDLSPQYSPVGNATQCQAYCQKVIECQYYVYVSTSKICWLKTALDYSLNDPYCVTGIRCC